MLSRVWKRLTRRRSAASPSSRSGDNRRFTRHRVVFPIQVSSPKKKGRIGICRNGSGSGLLLGTPSEFEVGDELELRFRLHGNDAESVVVGTIVRLAEEAPNRDHWCHRLVAVAFAEPDPTLDRRFADLAPAQASLFG